MDGDDCLILLALISVVFVVLFWMLAGSRDGCLLISIFEIIIVIRSELLILN